MNFQEQVGNNPIDNDGGIRVILYFALIEWFETIQTRDKEYDDPDAEYADFATISQTHLFKEGHCFKRFEMIKDSGGLNSELQGETQSKSALNKVTGKRIGTEAELIGFFERHKNDSFMLMTVDKAGKVRQVGSEEFPTTFTAIGVITGGKTADEKHCSFEANNDGRFAPVYTGDISLTPAVAPQP